jgi:hypothetical protein
MGRAATLLAARGALRDPGFVHLPDASPASILQPSAGTSSACMWASMITTHAVELIAEACGAFARVHLWYRVRLGKVGDRHDAVGVS